MEQVLCAVGEHVVLLVERLGLLLCVGLIGSHPLLDALLRGLGIARGDESLLVFLLQLCSLGLEVLLTLRPALLCLFGLLLQGLAFIQKQIALSQHGLHLNVGDVARSDLLRRCGLRCCRLGRRLRRFRAAGGQYEGRSQHREEKFFHIV